ncbi:MAG: hypothetical protein WBN40_03405 [Pseudomonadales bacterium]
MYKKILASLAALSVTCAAQSQETAFSYTYVDVGYIQGKAQDYDAGGLRVAASRAINRNVYALASYTSVITDDEFLIGATPDEQEYSELAFGFGFHTNMDETPDFLAEVQYVKADADIGNQNATGYRVAAGFRMPGGERFEVRTMINHTRLEGDRDTGFALGGRARLGESSSLGLGYEKTLNLKAFSFDVRFEL